MTYTFISKKEACDLLKISERTLARYRSDHWYLGIHYVKPVQKILYNKELIEDWLVNKHDWGTHMRAIEAYQSTLPSNQPKRKRAS
jgi:Helix-turn-helix domain